MSSVTSVDGVDVTRDPRLARLREATGKVVGAVFYGTLLKSMRDSALRGTIGHGGHAERVFEAQLDAELATRAGQASGTDLAVALFKHLAGQQLRIGEAQIQQTDGTTSDTDAGPVAENGVSAWLDRLSHRSIPALTTLDSTEGLR